MHKRFLSTILLVAVMLVARPAFAETNLGSLEALIQSLMAQVQELQRQLAILQGEAGEDVIGDITVTSPVANSQWKLGDTMLISWKGQTSGVDTLSIHLISYKGGRTEVMAVASNVDVNTDSLKWVIPEEVILVGGIGSGYAIELRGKAFSTESGQFSIVKKFSDDQPNITVVSPNGGEKWGIGKTYTIKWNAEGYASSTPVQIGLRDSRYHPATVEGEAVITNTTNKGKYVFTVPPSLRYLSGGTLGGQSVYSVVMYVDGGGSSDKYDVSDRPFSIASSTSATSSILIHVKNDVQYGTDTNSAFITTSIGAGSQNSTVYSWKLAISCASGVTLVVPSKTTGPGQSMCGTTQTYYTYNYPGINDGIIVLGAEGKNTNDSEGNIVYALTAYDASGRKIGGDKDGVVLGAGTTSSRIQVVSPNGGEKWVAGNKYTITWKSDNLPTDTVGISVVPEYGNLTTVVWGAKNTGSYTWVIPESLISEKAGYKMLVSSTDKGPSVEDYSDDWFEITRGVVTYPPTTTDPYQTSKVLGVSASYQDVLNQMANTLKGMQELLQGLQ